MARGPVRPIAIMLACAGLGVGCVQSGPIQNRRTTIGTLKTSVSRLEFEKEELRKQMAELQAENRRAEERLSQEEALNGELTARLDDARGILRSRGYDTDNLYPSPRSARERGDDQQTTPASQPPRRNRRAPFARIPGRIDPVPPGEDASSSRDDPLDLPPAADSGSDPFGPQSRRVDHSSWLPVARGRDGLAGSVR